MMSRKSLFYNLLNIVDLAVMALCVCAIYNFLIFELPDWIIMSIILYAGIRNIMIIVLMLNEASTFVTIMPMVYSGVGIICLGTASGYLDNTMTIYSENGKYGIKSKHTSHIFAESVYDTVYSRNIVSGVWRHIKVENHDTTIKQSSHLVFFLEKNNKFGLVTYKEVIAQPVFDSIVITSKCYEENVCYDVFKCYDGSSIKTIDYTGNEPPNILRVRIQHPIPDPYP
jgi:hypothetical protein